MTLARLLRIAAQGRVEMVQSNINEVQPGVGGHSHLLAGMVTMNQPEYGVYGSWWYMPLGLICFLGISQASPAFAFGYIQFYMSFWQQL